MPLKTKVRRSHHKGKTTERHGKKFLKVYAPYLPLVIIVGLGLFISTSGSFKQISGGGSGVLAYATNISDSGLLDSTNEQRTKAGLDPLKYNVVLDKAAQDKANDMSARNYWSHNTPDGKEPWMFVEDAGYKFSKAAENLAYGFADSKSTVVGWMNSPTHRANLLDPELKDVGFGMINVENYIGKGPETIIVAMYGTPSQDSETVIASGSASRSTGTNHLNADSQLPSKKISYAQMITGGNMPWLGLATGILIGVIVMYLLFRHSRNILKAFKKGEKFILKHPLFDATVIALLALATIVVQTAGVIH